MAIAVVLPGYDQDPPKFCISSVSTAKRDVFSNRLEPRIQGVEAIPRDGVFLNTALLIVTDQHEAPLRQCVDGRIRASTTRMKCKLRDCTYTIMDGFELSADACRNLDEAGSRSFRVRFRPRTSLSCVPPMTQSSVPPILMM